MPDENSSPEVIGHFEIHITVAAPDVDRLALFADTHGLKYTHVVLDGGRTPSQPMLTLTGNGFLDGQRRTAEQWAARLRHAGLYVVRTKIEAAPWCSGVPATDEEAAAQPPGRYFEHHVKLLLPPGVTPLVAATELAERHDARLSRNARRIREDGHRERFVTQRCYGVGRAAARARLDALVAAFTADGHDIAAVEEEYVVFDDRIGLDAEWLESSRAREAERRKERKAPLPGGTGLPATYRPLPPRPGVWQPAVFDPALKQYEDAYRAGEPVFADPAEGGRWRAARRGAMRHLLAVVADTHWAKHLVLRGSVTMPAWCGDAAREPGDVDFVVIPPSMAVHSADADAILAGIVEALRERPGAGLDAGRVESSDIWTYERADGRRLLVPFATDDGQVGSVQADFVFGEQLPIAPTPIRLDGIDRPLSAAGPALSLAWKLMWLATDLYPQGKDLYDAVLLAERTIVERQLVRDLLRPEHGAEADDFTAESVLAWDVDWAEFVGEYPAIPGTAAHWRRRLALALDRMPGWR
ncbi:nucleotidyl transferase AbiEii/AbiGii toxin family protein [Micromonosporaceae bacterium DT55]|uniref:nucleotidyl transferase AbiEii/AbiGii toxin family protein n=1 Tax=Melissospora conviva TaxID=3388432 RepID=UPI003C1B6192